MMYKLFKYGNKQWTLSKRGLVLIFFLVASLLVSYLYLSYNSDDLYYQPLTGGLTNNQGTNHLPKEKHKHKQKGPVNAKHYLIQKLHEESGISDVRSKDFHSTVYDEIFKGHNLEGLLGKLSFNERCDLYFKNLYAKDENWKLDPNQDLPLDYRMEFDWDPFRLKVMDSAKEEFANEKGIKKEQVDEVDPEFESLIRSKHQAFLDKTKRVEQNIIDYISHLRIFNKCYITSDDGRQLNAVNSHVKKQKSLIKYLENGGSNLEKDSFTFSYTEAEKKFKTDGILNCDNLQSRIYPWLSTSYPVFERWDGTKYFTIPQMKDFINDEKVFEPTNSDARNGRGIAKLHPKSYGSESCFFNKYKNAMNGKGIVMSIGDKHVTEAVKLIRLLRALGNIYPIQVVYYDNLSNESKQRLIKAAREGLKKFPKSYDKVKHLFPQNEQAKGLPVQELWFVNVYNVVHSHYRNKFNKFGNKFLATMFNSFEEYILVDADTVLLKNPEFFFNLKGYKETGAFFYKDRTSIEFRPKADVAFFKKLSPSLVDSAVFDIPIMTNYTMGREFFDGMFQYMESGLVVIDRNQHFNAILMMIQLNFFKPVTGRIHGDKEIFFLAFAADGDERYHFDKFFAAAVGEATPTEYMKKDNGTPKRAKEICSCHPGHLNEEDNGETIAWLNSGFRFCGKADEVNYEEEFKHKSRFKHLKVKTDLEKLFKDPLRLKNAIIPPFNRKTDTLHENDSQEPKEGWRMDSGYCKSYLWCAYSSIGGKKGNDDNTLEGQFFSFGKPFVELSNYLGDVWNSA
ncbi:uncharacterized protein PRCAT00005014001 [Priceomyces carsonii]|uniref:uncharacterized protein n=1 Tax=Priceomyces carsonii TaxID=28549 RepID=UPI002ED7ED6A|nr:unnamed protein product [Priceomyces carsonii]